MLCFMEWFLLSVMIAVTIEVQPVKKSGISFEDCGKWFNVDFSFSTALLVTNNIIKN